MLLGEFSFSILFLLFLHYFYFVVFSNIVSQGCLLYMETGLFGFGVRFHIVFFFLIKFMYCFS